MCIIFFLIQRLVIAQREKLVSTLSKFLEVDIYGGCGPHKCEKNDKTCYSRIEKTYKFYLSFENSLCKVDPVKLRLESVMIIFN